MKLSQFFAMFRGEVSMKLEEDEAFCLRYQFWNKYHDAPEWSAEVRNVWITSVNGRCHVTISLKAA